MPGLSTVGGGVAAGELGAGPAATGDADPVLAGALGDGDAAAPNGERGAGELADRGLTDALTEGGCCEPGCADGSPAEPQPAAARAAVIARADRASDRRRIRASGAILRPRLWRLISVSVTRIYASQRRTSLSRAEGPSTTGPLGPSTLVEFVQTGRSLCVLSPISQRACDRAGLKARSGRGRRRSVSA